MALPLHATTGERVLALHISSNLRGDLLLFLIIPILVIIPLSFNAQPYFTFTPEMMSFDPAGYSTKWYASFFNDSNWQKAVKKLPYYCFFLD